MRQASFNFQSGPAIPPGSTLGRRSYATGKVQIGILYTRPLPAPAAVFGPYRREFRLTRREKLIVLAFTAALAAVSSVAWAAL